MKELPKGEGTVQPLHAKAKEISKISLNEFAASWFKSQGVPTDKETKTLKIGLEHGERMTKTGIGTSY